MKPLDVSSAAVALAVALLTGACASTSRSPSPPPPAGAAPAAPGDPGFDPSGPTPSPPVHACTKEAKVCPDGSAVGRTGRDCAFAPCPGDGGGSAPPGEPAGGGSCKDVCGNGTCEEVVCMAVGCPCSETTAGCPQDCR